MTKTNDNQATQDAKTPSESAWLQRLVMPCGVTLYQGDCLEILPHLTGIDAVITDPPYGITGLEWDSSESVFETFKICLKNERTVVSFALNPLSSQLICKLKDRWAHSWVWHKDKAGNIFQAKSAPMRVHEDIIVFKGPSTIKYNPQMQKREVFNKRKNSARLHKSNLYGERKGEFQCRGADDLKFPSSVLYFNTCRKSSHPTQKPVPLMAFLIETYTDETETVFDPYMGSGSTGVAAIRTGRKFIGIEKDPEHFQIAKERIERELSQLDLFLA